MCVYSTIPELEPQNRIFIGEGVTLVMGMIGPKGCGSAHGLNRTSLDFKTLILCLHKQPSSSLRAVLTEHLKLQNRIVFLMVPETGKSKIKAAADSAPGESPFPG